MSNASGVSLILRFSVSLPDLPLRIRHPDQVTGAGLKQLIRSSLPEPFAHNGLRLIQAGKFLDDTTSLATSLRLPTTVKKAQWQEIAGDAGNARKGKGKGKAKASLTDSESESPSSSPTFFSFEETTQVYFIHCSINDIALSPSELAEEAAQSIPIDTTSGDATYGGNTSSPSPSTTPAPLGFDRLLNAGFTAAEVSVLRSQFLALQSLTHTPENMPSGEELRRLEDRWMDEGTNTMEDGTITASGFDEEASSMDDIVRGAIMGFFWPVACALWLLREEGVWTWRQGVAVCLGILINMVFGLVKYFGS